MLMRPIGDRRVDVLEQSASSTIIGTEGSDCVAEVGGEIGADPVGAGNILAGCAPVGVNADLDRALGRLVGRTISVWTPSTTRKPTSRITSHGAKVAETLETLDDLVLVLREDTGETVGIQDHLVEGGVLTSGGGTILQHLGGIHVVTQAETTAGFLGDGELITSDHLDR